MKQDYSQLQELINSAKSLLTGISINYNSEIGPRTKQLVEISNKIASLIQKEYPEIANILLNATSHIVNRQMVPLSPYGPMVNKDLINAYSFGDIRTTIKIMDALYSKDMFKGKKCQKIFISHKSEDKPFVDALVNLLRLYIGSDAERIFCSSVPNYKIGLGKEIYHEIKTQFEDYEIFMIIIHSPRYYQSSICLNEMGASWILNNECCSFLTTDCDFDKLKGVIDDQYISIKVNSDDAEDRMNDFIGKVLNFFNLPKPDISTFSQWEADRDKFLKTVCKIAPSNRN